MALLLPTGVAQAQSMFGTNVQAGNVVNTPTGNPGVKLGDDTLMHVSVGAEAGYDSNVFYSDGNVSSTILRITPAFDFSNITRDGQIPGETSYDVSAALTYRQYLSSDVPDPNKTAWMPSIGAALGIHGGQALSFSLSDAFARTEEPPYTQNADVIDRFTNRFAAGMRLIPGGGRLQFALRYQNQLDLFVAPSYQVANNMSNTLVLDAGWRWLPKTSLFLHVEQGLVNYFSAKPTGSGSYPFHAIAGLRGLVTDRFAVNLGAGYTNAFYSTGPSTGGILGSLSLAAELLFGVGPIGSQIILGYQHDFRNSLFGNFYYVDSGYLAVRQPLGQIMLMASGRYDHRVYQGLPPDVVADVAGQNRVDDAASGSVSADYYLSRYFYAGVGATLSMVASDWKFHYASMPDTTYGVSFTKYQVFARLGATY